MQIRHDSCNSGIMARQYVVRTFNLAAEAQARRVARARALDKAAQNTRLVPEERSTRGDPACQQNVGPEEVLRSWVKAPVLLTLREARERSFVRQGRGSVTPALLPVGIADTSIGQGR